MRRRDLVIVGGVGALWPRIARAQAPERIRRIGVLHDYAETDRESQREKEFDSLDLYHATDGGEAALARNRRADALRSKFAASDIRTLRHRPNSDGSSMVSIR